MASFAHVEQRSQHNIMMRAEIAEQGFQHMSFTIELIARIAKRMAAAVVPALQRCAAAHRQAVQDRISWELALTAPRLMAELRAMRQRPQGTGDKS